MKNFSRVLSVVMAIAMLFTMSMSASAATYTDVSTSDSYYEAVEALSALGVVKGYEEGDFQPEGKITRAEAAAVIMRIMGMGSVESTRVNTQFTDVTSEHWASGIIAAAADSAIVNGMGDGTFAPSAEVTYDQVVKMLVCAMGYQKKAEASVAAGTNVFPTGYNIVANQKRITEGTTKTDGGATRGTVARLVYNALTVNLMDQTSFGSDVEFQEIPTQSILYTKLNAVQIETKLSEVSIDPTETKVTLAVSKYDDVAYNNGYGNALTAGVSYKTITSVKKGDVNLAGLQGLNVKALVDISDSADPVLLAVFPTAGKNVELVIDPILFAGIANTTTSGVTTYQSNIQYYKDAEATTVNTSSKIEASSTTPFSIYLNMNHIGDYTTINDAGVAINAYNLTGTAKINTNNKAYKFVDTDNNGYYDTLFVENASSFVVGKINAAEYQIFRDNSSSNFNSGVIFDGNKTYAFTPLDLDTEDEDVSYAIKDVDGNALAFEDIKTGDILTVAQSYDGEIFYYDITVSSASAVEGTITEVTNEKVKGSTETIRYYVIDGTPYRVNARAAESKLEAGTAGTFNITADGAIISYTLEASARAYGVVIATAEKTGSFSNGVQAQMITQDGTIKTFDFASKVYVNDASTATDMTAVTGTAAANFVAPGTIVIYETNSSDEIRKIYTTASAIEAKENDDVDVKTISATSDKYAAATGKLGSYYTTENTVIISVPQASVITAKDKDKYMLASTAALSDETGYTGTVVVDASSKEVTFAFITNLKVVPSMDSMPMVITGVSTTNVEGSTRQKFTGLVEGNEVSYVLADEDDLVKVDMTGDPDASTYVYSIGVNDVIQVVLNANDEIASYRHILKYNPDTANANDYIGLIANAGDEDNNKEAAVAGALYNLTDGTKIADVAAMYGYGVAGMGNKVGSRAIELFGLGYAPASTDTWDVIAGTATDYSYDPNAVAYVYGNTYSKAKTVALEAVETFDYVNSKEAGQAVTDFAKLDDIIYIYSFDGVNVLSFVIDVANDN